MIAWHRWLLVPLLGACVAACAAAGSEATVSESYGDEAVERQLLVMVRMPPVHFRPDVAYGSSYVRVGQQARRKIAQALSQNAQSNRSRRRPKLSASQGAK